MQSVHGNSHVELAAEVVLLRKEKANAVGHAPAQRAEITAIPKPRGEAGSKGFKLIREMKLDDTAEHKQLYRAIMVRGKKQSTIDFFCSGVSTTVSSNVPLISLLTFVKLTAMTSSPHSRGFITVSADKCIKILSNIIRFYHSL
jgi:hypothetical protein